MPYYIEPPHRDTEPPYNTSYNTKIPKAILEVEQRGDKFYIVRPPNIAKKWPGPFTTFITECFVKVPDSFGPARMLSLEDYSKLWQRYRNFQNKAATTNSTKLRP